MKHLQTRKRAVKITGYKIKIHTVFLKSINQSPTFPGKVFLTIKVSRVFLHRCGIKCRAIIKSIQGSPLGLRVAETFFSICLVVPSLLKSPDAVQMVRATPVAFRSLLTHVTPSLFCMLLSRKHSIFFLC